jgi:putative peptidoglycan lipid II flippase
VVRASHRDSTGRHAFLVGAGILLSRMMGLVRQRVFSHYFGIFSDPADAFASALRVPNFLQNLFGEGVLSASFIPVYARLLAQGPESGSGDEESGRVAGAIGAILALSTSLIVLVGVLATPYLMLVIAPGYHGEKRELTILLVRILFPGAGLLVCSAWCLGILNSHRKFFLSYSAPVIWNLAMIVTMLAYRRLDLSTLAVKLAWGTVAGSALQFGVQLPTVLRLLRKLRLHLDTRNSHVREVIRNFAPVSISRGVVQISAYVDQALATLLGTGAMAAMTTAQSLYTLPVSLFGMAVSAAELPAMSSALGNETEVALALRLRLNRGLRQIAFFIVPSAMAFLALGDVITAMLYVSGRFTRADAPYVWSIVAGSAIGLLASTMGRLYSSTYYALRDTRTPLRFAVLRVGLTIALGYLCAFPLRRWIGLEPQWGAAGLTASAGVAGWVEFTLLRRTLNRRIGPTGLPVALVVKLWAAAGVSAASGWAVKLAIGLVDPIAAGLLILGVYGVLYFVVTYLMGVPECAGTLRRLKK